MDTLIPLVTIFTLAIFVGFEIITKVPPLLHTPLMSGSNAISGITIIGAMISVATPNRTTTIIGFVAVVLATINVVGGFLVTHRMLGMFRQARGREPRRSAADASGRAAAGGSPPTARAERELSAAAPPRR
jgi:NAD(P) transhydrogenase subunit alpha